MPTKRVHSGLTILEVLIASSLLMLFFSSLFVFFHRGNTALRELDKSGSLQAELLALKVSLRSDFALTDIGSISIEPSGTSGARMDAASCIALSDWSRAENFSAAEGGPIWDQRVSYLCQPGTSKLDRIVFVPEAQYLHPRPIPEVRIINPDTIVRQVALSSDLREFEVSLEPARQEVRFGLSLGETGKPGVQAEFLFVPSNTKTRL